MEEKTNIDARPLANNDTATSIGNGDAGDKYGDPNDKDQGYIAGMYWCAYET